MCSLRHHTRGASPPRHKKHFSRCTIEEQPFIILILKPTGLSYANNHSQPPPRSALQSPHQPSELDSAVEEYFANGITLSTRTAYTSALKRYISFCNQYKIEQPFPLSECGLLWSRTLKTQNLLIKVTLCPNSSRHGQSLYQRYASSGVCSDWDKTGRIPHQCQAKASSPGYLEHP